MSFDLTYNVELEHPHLLRGGTYAINGTRDATLNITYNYSWFYYRFLSVNEGLRVLDNMPAYQVIDLLAEAISCLGIRRYDDYWMPTAGNAGAALNDLRTLSMLVPRLAILNVR